MKTRCAECGGKGAKPGKHRIGALCEACDGWGVVEGGPVSERSEALEAKGIPYKAEGLDAFVKGRKQDSSSPAPPPPAPELEEGELTAEEVLRRFSSPK